LLGVEQSYYHSSNVLYDFSVTARPVTAQNCVPLATGAIAWWPLDETSGTTSTDVVGNNDGQYVNGPVPGLGEVAGALHFNGIDQYVSVPDSDLWAFGANDFTIELWANFDAPVGGNGAVFIGNDEGPGQVNKWFFALGGDALFFTVYNVDDPSINFFLVHTPFIPIVGQWYHLAVTKTGTLFTIFLNGTGIGSEISTSPIANPDAPLTIGQAEELGYMNGLLDEIAIYNRALSADELIAIFEAGSAG